MGIVSCVSEALVTVALMLNWQFHGFPSAVVWKDQLFVSISARLSCTVGHPYHVLYRGTLKEIGAHGVAKEAAGRAMVGVA